MKTATVYEQFEHELLLHGYSPETVPGYVRHLSELVWHFQRLPDQISEAEHREYLMHLVFERKCSYYKMRSTIAALRAFFRFVLHHSEARILELIPSLNTPRKCTE